jgi:hypothetical protein
MSLDWSIENIPDYKEVCWIDGKMNPVTSALVFATMGVGLGSITERNAEEFGWRLALWQRLFNPLLVEVVDDEFVAKDLTIDDVRAHVGLHTNVSDETRPRWLKRMTDIHFRDFQRDHQVKERA